MPGTPSPTRSCRRVCCLDGDSDFLLVPGSHLASVPTPRGVLGQGAEGITGPQGDAGGVVCPPLAPGDVLVHAASLVWGRRGGDGAGRLVVAEFTARNDAQNIYEYGEEPAEAPEWVRDLTQTQQAALGWHESGPTGGDSGAAVLSDGKRSWVSPAVPPSSDQSSPLFGNSDRPATLRDPARHLGPNGSSSLPSEEESEYELERWRWDVSGMLIVRCAQALTTPSRRFRRRS